MLTGINPFWVSAHGAMALFQEAFNAVLCQYVLEVL